MLFRSTGYGRGGDVPSDNESEESEDIIPKHFNDMGEILGKRESFNPRHVLESSHVPDSESPELSELEGDILDRFPHLGHLSRGYRLRVPTFPVTRYRGRESFRARGVG